MAERTNGFMGVVDKLAGYYRDIEVAKESGNGQAATNVRPESIPDQTAVGRTDQTGPTSNAQATVGRVSFGGLEFDTKVLTTTGVLLAGLLAVRALK